jgi:hypothetical protein
LKIDRFAEIDHIAHREKLGSGDGDAKRECKGPDQAAIAIGPPAAQAGEQAEAAQQRHGAIGEADHQSAPHHDMRAVLHLTIPAERLLAAARFRGETTQIWRRM